MINNGASFDDETTSSEILCSEILCRIPFKKTSVSGETVQIDSKNEVEEEDALQLEQWIQNQEVILSHSSTMQLQEHCRGIVEEFDYQKKNIKVIVSSDTGFPIWEDTDIWMFSLSTPTSSVCTTEPNTSADIEPPVLEDSPKPKSDEMDQAGLFESINGWKLIDKKRLRMRRKENGRWRNTYLLELELTCVAPEKQDLLKHVQERTALRLSDDIEEPGFVLVDVVKKCVEEGKLKTITVGVTGFLSRDVDIPMNNETTFYLNIYDCEDDDVGSIASEEGILPGYPLVQNLDELCEKIGELTINDVCARVWSLDNMDNCYIRLLVTSLKPMSNFKKLTGHHVIITSNTNDRIHVLAVVNRVFSEEMVLTLQGVPRHSKEFFFSKKEGFTIQIAHEYEDRLLHENGVLEKLRFDLANTSSDIRFERFWKEKIKDYSRNYASFIVPNEAFMQIPINKKVLLGKCYDIQAPMEKKASFGIARRVNHFNKNELTLVFELISTKHLVDDADHFKISKALYYVDFDCNEDIAKDSNLSESHVQSQIYCLLNARNAKDPESLSLARRTSIGKEFKFFVFPIEERFQAKNHNKKRKNMLMKAKSGRSSAPPTPVKNNNTRSPVKNNNPPKWNLPVKTELKEENSKQFNTNPLVEKSMHPEDPRPPNAEISLANEPWKKLQTLPKKAKPLGFVQYSGYEMKTHLTEIRKGFDKNGNPMKTQSWQLGKQIAITAGGDEKEIKIRGQVYDTKDFSASGQDPGEQRSNRYGISFQDQESVSQQKSSSTASLPLF